MTAKWLAGLRWRALAVAAATLVAFAAIVLGALYGLAAGMAVVTCASLLLAGLAVWRPWKARPALEAALYTLDGTASTCLVLARERPVGPIDREAILAEEARLAKSTVEPPPPPRRPDPLGLSFDRPMGLRPEPYDEALDRFNGELLAHQNELAGWLAGWERGRWLEAAFVEAWLRVENTGAAPAGEVRVILRIPAGMKGIKCRPYMPFPPERPRFERRTLPDLSDLASKTPSPIRTRERSLGSIKGPDYLRDDKRLVVRFSASNLTHGVAELSAEPIRLVAEGPGTYEMEWEIHSSDLAAPARGVFAIEARPQPRSEEAVTSLDHLIGTGEVHVRQSNAAT